MPVATSFEFGKKTNKYNIKTLSMDYRRKKMRSLSKTENWPVYISICTVVEKSDPGYLTYHTGVR